MGEYIKPVQAFKKLDVAKLLRQGVYIYGATGYGKTELIHQYFKNQNYTYIPCEHNFCDLSVIPEEYTGTVIIEDVDVIEDEELRNEIAELCKRKKLWLIIAGRSKMPSWLFDSYIKQNMMLITEKDLVPTIEGVDKFMRSEGITLTEEELRYLLRASEGNFIAIKYTAQCLSSGEHFG